MSDLKPCPFCENKIADNRPQVSWDSSGHSVGCKNCGAVGPNKDTAEEAEAAWNARPVADVPNEDELIEAFGAEYEKHTEGYRILPGIRAIHALLIQRQGGRG